MDSNQSFIGLDTSKINFIFSWYDYSFFVGMLGISTIIGIYFGCFGNKQSTTKDYLLGGKAMTIIPISLSLIASNISGITLLGVPADVYKYGASYVFICLSYIPIGLVTAYVVLPVFSNLQITSTYEYIGARFNNKLRLFSSFLYTLSMFLYNPLVIYGPALALTQATGLSLHLITPIVCVVCIFYTTIGGLKAVVWTDALQFIILMGSSLVVFVLGTISAGGFDMVWQKSLEGQRLDIFNFEVDPTKRDALWNISFGSMIGYMFSVAINQCTIQRFLALPSLTHARKSIVIFIVGLFICNVICVLTGLIMYAKYFDCDPLSSQKIAKLDQILPFYVMDVSKNVPGLSGLFVAGIFSAALSTLSTTLNAIAATIYEDFLSQFMPSDVTESTKSNILKIIVVIFGVICTFLVFIIEHLGNIIPLTLIFAGVIKGPLTGLFLLGMLIPFANSKGAFFGTITGVMLTLWIAVGGQYYKMKGVLVDPSMPFSTEGCHTSNTTMLHYMTKETKAQEDPFYLYQITFYLYGAIGAITTMSVGALVSWLTGGNRKAIAKKMLSPVIYKLLPKSDEMFDDLQYYSVEKASDKMNGFN